MKEKHGKYFTVILIPEDDLRLSNGGGNFQNGGFKKSAGGVLTLAGKAFKVLISQTL